ncbi:hypothetical protein D3C71_1967320 [compost metagenome]
MVSTDFLRLALEIFTRCATVRTEPFIALPRVCATRWSGFTHSGLSQLFDTQRSERVAPRVSTQTRRRTGQHLLSTRI